MDHTGRGRDLELHLVSCIHDPADHRSYTLHQDQAMVGRLLYNDRCCKILNDTERYPYNFTDDSLLEI